MRVWNFIPPNRPNLFSSLLGKIVRNLSLDKYESDSAQKRGAGILPVILEEIEECIPSKNNIEEKVIDSMLYTEILNRFLYQQKKEVRKIFVRRYWYMNSIKEISADFNISESKVKMILHRTRNHFKEVLEKEGVFHESETNVKSDRRNR